MGYFHKMYGSRKTTDKTWFPGALPFQDDRIEAARLKGYHRVTSNQFCVKKLSDCGTGNHSDCKREQIPKYLGEIG